VDFLHHVSSRQVHRFRVQAREAGGAPSASGWRCFYDRKTLMSELRISQAAGRSRIEVRVTTRASRSEVTGVRDGKLVVRLAAPPVDGEANDELIRTMASLLHVKRSDVRIISGLASRNKLLEVACGVDEVLKLAAVDPRD
jgi:uncharacterized protein (TIGR00251 family)